METANWIVAGASVLNLLVLATYAWFTWGIWNETRQSARRTEELVEESRAEFKLHVLETYLQGRSAALALGDPQGHFEARTRYELVLLKGLLQMTFPDKWEEIRQFEEKIARDPELRAER